MPTPETKWTKGPWRALHYTSPPEDMYLESDAGFMFRKLSTEEHKATAKLISLAPELFEALRHAQTRLLQQKPEALADDFDLLKEIESILAKLEAK